jgi:hypothetical protein
MDIHSEMRCSAFYLLLKGLHCYSTSAKNILLPVEPKMVLEHKLKLLYTWSGAVLVAEI